MVDPFSTGPGKRPRSADKDNGAVGQGKKHSHTRHGSKDSSLVSKAVLKAKKLAAQRRQLPIYEAKSTLVSSIKKHKTVVVIGETGSGKTTQLPQYLYEAGMCTRKQRIGCTQPRRVAAMTVAQRVSDEAGSLLGSTVGYSIRFDDVTSPDTKIQYMTDGILLREALLDHKLSKYSVIIVDEAHERTLHTDILLGILKSVQRERPSLRLVIMSATLNAEQFATYFDDAPILYVEGRQHPVQVMYTDEPQPDYLDAVLTTVLQLHLESPRGDVLVFLTGQEEINDMAQLLNSRAKMLPENADKMIIAPIYAALPPEQQLLVFSPTPSGCRKIILATNIAETSITINGIKYVVDPGLAKVRGYNSKIGIDSLLVMPVSKAQCRQRAGRAGREGPGTVYRLFTEDTFSDLDETALPEILRVNLASVVLTLKALGIDDVVGFDFVDKPSTDSIVIALESLYTLGALDKKGHLSPLGQRMSQFPLDPALAKVLLSSVQYECTKEILTIVSMLSCDNVLFAPKSKKEEADQAHKRFASVEGDHFTWLNIYNGYISAKGNVKWCHDNFINVRAMKRVLSVRQQLGEYCKRQNLDTSLSTIDFDNVKRCLVTGFFSNVAQRQADGSMMTVNDHKTVSIHPSSSLFGRRVNCVLYNELVLTSKLYIRDTCVIEPEWILELSPGNYEAT